MGFSPNTRMRVADRLQRELLKAEIRGRFGSMSNFDRKAKLAPGSTRDVVRGRTSQRTQKAIAKALGKTVQELFHPVPHKARVESTNRDDSPESGTTHRLSAEAS